MYVEKIDKLLKNAECSCEYAGDYGVILSEEQMEDLRALLCNCVFFRLPHNGFAKCLADKIGEAVEPNGTDKE